MILEYVAQSAVADLRRFATPAALGSAVLSRGVEEHAGFSTQSARASTDAVAAYRAVLACELVAAVRVLRMQGRAPAGGGPLRAAFDAADAVLDPRTADRPLDADLAVGRRAARRVRRFRAGLTRCITKPLFYRERTEMKEAG